MELDCGPLYPATVSKPIETVEGVASFPAVRATEILNYPDPSYAWRRLTVTLSVAFSLSLFSNLIPKLTNRDGLDFCEAGHL